MARLTFICEKCNKSEQIVFTPGEAPKPPVCSCGTTMSRDWGKVGTGSVVTEDMVAAAQTMLNSGTISGRDKKLF